MFKTLCAQTRMEHAEIQAAPRSYILSRQHRPNTTGQTKKGGGNKKDKGIYSQTLAAKSANYKNRVSIATPA